MPRLRGSVVLLAAILCTTLLASCMSAVERDVATGPEPILGPSGSDTRLMYALSERGIEDVPGFDRVLGHDLELIPKLNPLGYSFSTTQLYWMAAMPGLSAGLFRLLWMVLPPVMGTRKMVALTSLLLVFSTLGVYSLSNSTFDLVMLMIIGGIVVSMYLPIFKLGAVV